MENAKFKLTSSCPIMFHNVNSMDIVKPKSMTHADFEKSDEMFKARLYLEDNKLTFPPRMIFGALKKAAQKSGIRQDGKRSTYANIIRAVIFCRNAPILDKKLSDVERHSEYVTVQNSKILRIFPMLREWETTLELTFDEAQISLEALEDIFNYCGKYCGFGDYRPQFGRFTVTKIK